MICLQHDYQNDALSMTFTVWTIADVAIRENDIEPLRRLLHSSFPDYFTTRIYNKQAPIFRIFIKNDDAIIAHVAIECRMITLDAQPTRVFGIVDLCVQKDLRCNGLGSYLLQQCESLALQHKGDCLLAFADDDRVYSKAGFQQVECSVRWLAMHEHVSLEVREETFVREVFVKTLHGIALPNTKIDLLGYIF